MRRYSYVATWWDKGRFERTTSGYVIGSSVSSAAGRAIRMSMKGAKKARHGWSERFGEKFRLSIIVGPKTTNGKDEE